MEMESKVLGNRYEILSKVGVGGMALVYKAKDRLLNRFVAVKMLREEFKENEEFIRRFNVESQAAACLSHQNIVQIYDVGEEDGIHYIVMELLEGNTLKKYIDENHGKLSWREATNFTMQICRALEHAHSKHVVHRDIKPQNIIITEGNKLKVADFGIARAANNTTTVNSLNTAVGSAHYLSPEQARGGYTDGRSDIYSLGVVMYEMFTGKLPFDADSGVSVIAQHLHENPIPPCEINPDIPRGIEAIIMRAMMKEQRLRYKTASDMLEDLIRVYQNPAVKVSELNAYISGEEGVGSGASEKNQELQKRARNIKAKKKRKNKNAPLLIAFFASFALLIMFLVFLLFFNNTKEVRIPDLTGLTYEEAAEVCKETSHKNIVFEVVKERMEHSTKERDTIISQNPEGGTNTKSSKKIKVVISLGEVAIELEDYSGEEYEVVKTLLTDVGVKVIKKDIDSDTYEEGIIVKQLPGEGTELAKGEEVTLYVSEGTKNTVVPNVLGKTRDEATILIERNDLKVGKIYERPNLKYKEGQIFKQSIKAFETVPADTEIDLYIANGEKESLETGEETPKKENPEKTISITLGNLPKDREKVNIRLVHNGKPFIEGDYSTREGKVVIPIKTDKTLSLDVYYDSVYITTKEVKY